MSDLYEEYGLELEEDPSLEAALPEEKKEPTIKKSGGWLRSAIALVLGIVIGVGAVAGGGYLALSSPARDTIETIGGFAGLNYEEDVQNKFLSEEYEDKTLLEIGKELAKVIKDKNLVGMNNIAPVIGEYLDKLVNNMHTEFGVQMDSDTIIATPFTELPTYLGETFRTTPLGNMLRATSKVDKLEPILMEICYGEEGLHYHYDENGEVVMNEGYEAATFETLGSTPNAMINKVSLAAVLPPNADDALMMSMSYGRETVTYIVEKNTDGTTMLDENGHPVVTMLPLFFEKDGDAIYDYNGDLVACELSEAENGFIRMEKAPTYEGATTETYYLKAGADGKYYAYRSASDDAEQATFKKTMLGDLSANSSAMINNIYLKDALNVKYDPAHPENDPHAILFSLAYGTEGVDYTVDPTTKEITMIGDAQPRTIGDLRDRGTDLINDVAISDIMHAAHDDALGMYLLYGKNDIHYALDGDNVVMLQQYIAIADATNDNSNVYNEYGERLQHAEGENPGFTLNTAASTFTDVNGNLYTYKAADPEKTIKTNDGQMKVYYLYKDSNGDGKYDSADEPAMFAKHSLAELAGSDNLISRLTDRLSLSEVLHDTDLSTNKFLKHVSDCPVNDIPNELMEISVTDMFSEEIYGEGAIKHEGETPLIAADGQIIANGDFYTVDSLGYHKAQLKSTWKYLLTDPNGIKQPSDYKAATDMGTLVTNMTANVDNATLNSLNEDGLIADMNPATLASALIAGYSAPLDEYGNPKTTMGQLTVTEMLDYTAWISNQLTP